MMTSEQREAIKERLALIEKANGGRLTPDDVVQDAKKKDSPLHAHFEWDTKKAAAAYWIEQARELIVSVRVVVRTEHTRVSAPYYVRDPNAESGQQGYVSVPMLRTDQDMARDALVAEFGRVAAMLTRARALAAALEAADDVDALLQNVVGLRQRFMEHPGASAN